MSVRWKTCSRGLEQLPDELNQCRRYRHVVGCHCDVWKGGGRPKERRAAPGAAVTRLQKMRRRSLYSQMTILHLRKESVQCRIEQRRRDAVQEGEVLRRLWRVEAFRDARPGLVNLVRAQALKPRKLNRAHGPLPIIARLLWVSHQLHPSKRHKSSMEGFGVGLRRETRHVTINTTMTAH